MYLIETKDAVSQTTISSMRLIEMAEQNRLKPIQPGQSRTSGFDFNDHDELLGTTEEGINFLTFVSLERKYSKKQIEEEAKRRAAKPGCRHVCEKTGVPNLRSIRQEILDEILDSGIPTVTSTKVWFVGNIVAFDTSSALEADSALHCLPQIEEQIVWRPDLEKLRAGLVKTILNDYYRLSGTVSLKGDDGERVTTKGLGREALQQAVQSVTLGEVASAGFDSEFGEIIVSSKGKVKVQDQSAILEAVNLLKQLEDQ